jgi:hypothetical protein
VQLGERILRVETAVTALLSRLFKPVLRKSSARWACLVARGDSSRTSCRYCLIQVVGVRSMYRWLAEKLGNVSVKRKLGVGFGLVCC